MRKMILSLVVLAFAALSAGAASASAASTTCETSGTIKLSPGLSNTAQVQNVSIKGTLSNCASVESGVKSGKFNAHFKTEAVTCAILTGVGAAGTESKINLKWTPKGEGNSQGSFSMPVTESGAVSLGGLVESGPFAGGAIGGSVTQSYTGGKTCGEGKKAKKVSKGTFTGSLSA